MASVCAFCFPMAPGEVLYGFYEEIAALKASSTVIIDLRVESRRRLLSIQAVFQRRRIGKLLGWVI
jgi:hypothetical protein